MIQVCSHHVLNLLSSDNRGFFHRGWFLHVGLLAKDDWGLIIAVHS